MTEQDQAESSRQRWPCEVCGIEFNHRNSRSRHIRKQHPDTISLGLDRCCGSFGEFKDELKEHELRTGTHFIIYGKSWGEEFDRPLPKLSTTCRVQWYNDSPYIVVATRVYECDHGPERNKIRKQNYADRRQMMEVQDHVFLKRRSLAQTTKKFDCSAQVKVSRVLFINKDRVPGLVVPDFKESCLLWETVDDLSRVQSPLQETQDD